MKVSEKTMSKTNKTKTNATINFKTLYNDLLTNKCKNDMVETYKKYGIKCETAPTKTPNTSDLYAQFNRVGCGDLSRLQMKKNCIKVFCTVDIATALEKVFNNKHMFTDCDDGGKRVKTCTLDKTLENYTNILQCYIDNGVVTL